jgi:hypothetical protein
MEQTESIGQTSICSVWTDSVIAALSPSPLNSSSGFHSSTDKCGMERKFLDIFFWNRDKDGTDRRNFMSIKTVFAILALMTLGLLVGRFTAQPVARAQGGCTVANLKGAYGLAVNGFFYDPFDGSQGIYSSAGLAIADGNGGITGTDTLNLDGTPTRGRQFTGTYTVNPDCTGTMNLKDAKNVPITNMDMVITNGGKDVVMTDYDTDLILNGTAKLQ